jgi:hypothetical protein
LKDTVLEGGIPFNKAHGMTSFEYHGKDLRFNKVFNKGMSDHSTITMKKILETYKGFEGLTSVVDVGGGRRDVNKPVRLTVHSIPARFSPIRTRARYYRNSIVTVKTRSISK